MAEAAKAEAASKEAAAKPVKSRLKVIIIVAGLMVAEGAGVFVVTTLVRPDPAPAAAAEAHGDEGHGDEHGGGDAHGEKAGGHGGGLLKSDLAEVALGVIDVVNARDGRPFIYHVELSALVSKESEEVCEQFVEARKGSISDRISTVVRTADPKYFQETGLETLRRQIKFELDKIMGDDGLIKEILVTKLLQMRSNL